MSTVTLPAGLVQVCSDPVEVQVCTGLVVQVCRVTWGGATEQCDLGEVQLSSVMW